ncbi:MAG: hypothetical protein JWM91_5123 [Rhodospirillales bacterium]|nr:hypothetical protein [Rhodospirillales bacterium]
MDFAQSQLVKNADLVKNAFRHAEAEGSFDMAGTLATLEADPVYDLFPVGLRMVGMDRARRYYEHYFAEVAPRIVHFALVAEWINENGVCQEYDVTYRHDDKGPRVHRILGILTFGKLLLSGERIYTDEEMLRIMFGPVWDELEPISP